MKKLLKIIGALLVAAALFAGGYLSGQNVQISSILSAMPKQAANKFHNETPPDEIKTPAESLPPAAEKAAGNIEDRKINVSSESAVDESWSKVAASQTASTGETITLYTSATTEDGEIIWDDSQKWVLEAQDGSGNYYTLYDQLVSNGSVYYDIIRKDNGEQLINVYTQTSAGTTILQYAKNDSGYTEKSIYNSGSVNRLFSSIPNYN